MNGQGLWRLTDLKRLISVKFRDTQGGYAGFGYHGNGVAMASYAGALFSDMVLDQDRHAPLPQGVSTHSYAISAGAVSPLYACANLCAGPKRGFMTAAPDNTQRSLCLPSFLHPRLAKPNPHGESDRCSRSDDAPNNPDVLALPPKM